jgi:hypothetical protein
VDPNPDSKSESGSRRAKITHKNRKKLRIYNYCRSEGRERCAVSEGRRRSGGCGDGKVHGEPGGPGRGLQVQLFRIYSQSSVVKEESIERKISEYKRILPFQRCYLQFFFSRRNEYKDQGLKRQEKPSALERERPGSVSGFRSGSPDLIESGSETQVIKKSQNIINEDFSKLFNRRNRSRIRTNSYGFERPNNLRYLGSGTLPV